MNNLSVLHAGLFAYAEVEHEVAVRHREKGGRGWPRASEALSLAVRQWRAFLFLRLICAVVINPPVFINFN